MEMTVFHAYVQVFSTEQHNHGAFVVIINKYISTFEFFSAHTLSFHKCVTACVGHVSNNLLDLGEFSNVCCKSDMYM